MNSGEDLLTPLYGVLNDPATWHTGGGEAGWGSPAPSLTTPCVPRDGRSQGRWEAGGQRISTELGCSLKVNNFRIKILFFYAKKIQFSYQIPELRLGPTPKKAHRHSRITWGQNAKSFGRPTRLNLKEHCGRCKLGAQRPPKLDKDLSSDPHKVPPQTLEIELLIS